MIVTYLDIKTGKKATEKGISIFSLTDGNWSCDCNRANAFNNDIRYESSCDGCVRYIVIDIELEDQDKFTNEAPPPHFEIIAEANSGYYHILKGWEKIIKHAKKL